MKKKVIKVSATTNVKKLAASISYLIEEQNSQNIELRAIGASSVNQMYKAVAILRSMVAIKGRDIFIKPGFHTIPDEKNERLVTAMVAYLDIR